MYKYIILICLCLQGCISINKYYDSTVKKETLRVKDGIQLSHIANDVMWDAQIIIDTYYFSKEGYILIPDEKQFIIKENKKEE